MGPLKAIIQCSRKFASLSGRAPRSEFWWWLAFSAPCTIGVGFAAFYQIAAEVAARGGEADEAAIRLALSGGIPWAAAIYTAFLIPTIAVAVRRLHDTGWTGLWALPFAVSGADLAGFYWTGESMVYVGSVWNPIIGIAWFVLNLLGLVTLVRFFFAGTAGDNAYGPDPRERTRAW